MGKIRLTESQYNKLKDSLLEMTMRTYIFDWDDNILYMPTTIKMDKKDGNKWVPVDVSTEDFTHIRTNPNYRLRNNSPKEGFKDFSDSKPFIEDVKKAIHNDNFAPSADKFKEALIYASPFAINTARGHQPNIIRDGVRLFIDMVFTDEEKSEMLENIRNILNKSKNLTDDQSIDFYLDEMGEYYPVTSNEFGNRFSLDVSGGASSPEHAKKVAIEHFTKKVFNNIEKLVDSDYKKFSIGFSDDDLGNVKAAEEFIADELKMMYPEIHFVIYDTSDKGKRKMVIEKE
tara:strand:- start:10786 stop:11646 length:861 start_codon:yes stop_codon:yes gene_type:complete